MPAPKPTAAKRLRGTLRPGRVRQDEPQPAPATDVDAAIPPELTDDPIASAEWSRLVPILRDAKLLTAADRQAVMTLAMEWSVYVRSRRAADADNLTTQRGTGATGISPHATTAHRCVSNLLRLWTELGLTPTARTRIGTSTSAIPIGPDPFAEFDVPPTIGRH